MQLLQLTALLLGYFLLQGSVQGAPKPLFNGTDFQGWRILPGGEWSVSEGVITGRIQKQEKRHGMLLSEKRYRDFKASFEFQCAKGDSGFYFRVEEVKHAVSVKGFQVEVDASMETGGLYETLGRAWVSKPDPEKMKKIYTPGEWTRVEVTAQGIHLLVKVNGEVVTDLQDAKCSREGFLGLQLHGGMDMEVRYRNLMIEELPEGQ